MGSTMKLMVGECRTNLVHKMFPIPTHTNVISKLYELNSNDKQINNGFLEVRLEVLERGLKN